MFVLVIWVGLVMGGSGSSITVIPGFYSEKSCEAAYSKLNTDLGFITKLHHKCSFLMRSES